jgi:hypothetical protein
MPQYPEEEAKAMIWFSAHVIMFVQFKEGNQAGYPVWENIILVEACSEDEAFEKAEQHGRAAEGDDEGSFRWGKRPAKWVFAGVRKLTECQILGDRPDDGTELTYNEFELSSREAVKKLVAGKPVDVRFHDRYRPAEEASDPEGESKPGKRKRA